jgi:hypothetical protein
MFRGIGVGVRWVERGGLALLVCLGLTALVRALLVVDYLGFSYPSGADWGHHLFYADLYLAAGKLPVDVPFFQLGRTQWVTLPGGALTFAVLAGLSGTTPFAMIGSIVIYGLIEVSGVYFLAHHTFRNRAFALVAALTVALVPLSPEMMAWGNYPNLIALALVPWVMLAWLQYWAQPTARWLIITVVLVVGSLSVHHLSSTWLVLTLALFSLAQLIRQPIASLRKLLPLAAVGLLVGLPVLLRMLKVWSMLGTANLLSDTNRYDITRISWFTLAQLITPIGLLLLLVGLFAFARLHWVDFSSRVMILAYVFTTVVFGFGWLWNLKFYYSRAIYYLAVPLGFGVVGLMLLWRSGAMRTAIITVLVCALSVIAVVRTSHSRQSLQALSPGAVEAARWLTAHTNPDEVIVLGTLLGFQLPRLLQRPTLVGLPADLVGNVQEVDMAAAAVAILTGSPDTERLLDLWRIKFVVIDKNPVDRPNPRAAYALLSRNPQFEQVFENSSVVIFQTRQKAAVESR